MSTIIYHTTAGWTVDAPELTESEEDWDILTTHEVVYAVSRQAAIATYTKGQSHPNHANIFFVEGKAKELVCGAGFFDLVGTWKGVSRNKPLKYKLRTFAERNSYSSVRLMGTALATYPGAADVSEPRAALTVKYISLTLPNQSQIGTEQTPPLAIGYPANIWTLIVDGVLGYPAGWVLDSREGPNIPGAEAWMVEDVYSYYPALRPMK